MSQDDAGTRVWKYLDEQGLTKKLRQLLPLTGDASDRRYYRVILRNADSMVLAVHGGPIEFDRMPFVSVARLLAAIPLPVPRILHHSDDLGIIGLQDLGDVTLQAHLGAATPDEHDALYRQAVSLIARLQSRGAELVSEEYPPYGMAFDTDKLAWEFEFFYKYFLKAYRGVSPSVAVQKGLSKEWSAIVEELAGEPRVLCHRDYHSRNLMLRGGELFIIDFQDARMGPDTYDLVSLLRDSYVDLTSRQVDELIAYFLALKDGAAGVSAEQAGEFRRRFDVMALQRNFKALGTFGYQTVSRGNAGLHSVHPSDAQLRTGQPREIPTVRPLQELLAPPDRRIAINDGLRILQRSPAVNSPLFGVSTHLFHDQRLDRDHLVEIAAHGFDCVELFATRTHFDYHDGAAVRALAEWLEDTRLILNSVHAPIHASLVDGKWGEPFSNALPDETHAARCQKRKPLSPSR